MLLTAAFGIDIGLDPELARVIMQTIDRDESGVIEFVEFVSYIPFFVRLHNQICSDPLMSGTRIDTDGLPMVEIAKKLQEDILPGTPRPGSPRIGTPVAGSRAGTPRAGTPRAGSPIPGTPRGLTSRP